MAFAVANSGPPLPDGGADRLAAGGYVERMSPAKVKTRADSVDGEEWRTVAGHYASERRARLLAHGSLAASRPPRRRQSGAMSDELPTGVGGERPLDAGERRRLLDLEEVVERGLDAFLAVADALLEIRGRRLYRQSHSSFEDYCRDRWGLARRTAYGYIEAAGVAANVEDGAHALSLSHLRALAPLSAEDQRALAGVISPMTVAEARRVIRLWRAQQRAALPRETPPLPDGTFRCICADPPWAFENDWGDGVAADHYAPMTTEAIAALPVAELAAPDSHLYLWVPGSLLPEALRVCEEWGFSYKALLTWVKPGLGLGNYWRVATEHICFATRGTLPTQARDLRNWFEARRTRHSEKPAEFYRLVERASPGPYLELFARQARTDWTTWGNEVPRAAA